LNKITAARPVINMMSRAQRKSRSLPFLYHRARVSLEEESLRVPLKVDSLFCLWYSLQDVSYENSFKLV